MKTLDFLDEFIKDLRKSLERGEEKWGDTWLHRPKKGQEERIAMYIKDSFDKYKYTGKSVRWESIAGECLIGWIREKNPEMFPKEE